MIKARIIRMRILKKYYESLADAPRLFLALNEDILI
jgi:hypothetical protein